MAALTQNQPMRIDLGDFDDYPLGATAHVFQGSMVGEIAASGYARPFEDGDQFLGHAIDEVDNSDGDVGDKNVRVRRGTYYAKVAVTDLVITSLGAPVYATTDNDLSITDSGTDTQVGIVQRYISDGVGIVKFTAPSGA